MRTMLFVCVIASVPLTAGAQDPAQASKENPLSANSRMMYGMVSRQMVLAAAEKMPEAHYSFRPTDEVRTYGQIVGHIADLQYVHCSTALMEKNPAPQVEKTRTSKADLIAALKDAIAYCDRAYNGMTDAAGAEIVKSAAYEMPKLGWLSVNLSHSSLHYGNLVTYLRLKGIVPPSSEPGFGRPKK